MFYLRRVICYELLVSEIDTQYQTTDQQVVDSFLIPTLSEAKRYCRVSAYFSLKGIQLLAAGLEQLACNDGRYQLLLSSHISETDFDEIKQGYEWRNRLRENCNVRMPMILIKSI